MRRSATFLAMVAAGLVACAPMTLSAQDCVVSGGEVFANAPVDAKSGVVAWIDGSAATPLADGLTRQTFLDCATGAATQVRLTGNIGPLGTRDVGQEVRAMLYSVPERPRLAQLRDGLSAMGISFLETTLPSETCACAVFYPELRGDKRRFEASI